MAGHDDEEGRALRLEFNWILQNEVPSILKQLKNIVKNSLHKFKSPSTPGQTHLTKPDNFILSIPNSDAVKGLISIAGDCVIKAEFKFKFPKIPNGTFGTFIFEQCPWRLQQLQDSKNHLDTVFELISERESCGSFTSASEVLELMDRVMASLSRGKACLIVPEKHQLSELMALGAQRVMNPPIPDELLVHFHVNCDKIVFCVYVLTLLTAAPNQKNVNQDHTQIGHTFEYCNRFYEVINRIEIICTVPWLKDVIVLFNTAQQLCQQLKDKVIIFQNLLPYSDLGDEMSYR